MTKDYFKLKIPLRKWVQGENESMVFNSIFHFPYPWKGKTSSEDSMGEEKPSLPRNMGGLHFKSVGGANKSTNTKLEVGEKSNKTKKKKIGKDKWLLIALEELLKAEEISGSWKTFIFLVVTVLELPGSKRTAFNNSQWNSNIGKLRRADSSESFTFC